MKKRIEDKDKKRKRTRMRRIAYIVIFAVLGLVVKIWHSSMVAAYNANIKQHSIESLKQVENFWWSEMLYLALWSFSIIFLFWFCVMEMINYLEDKNQL